MRLLIVEDNDRMASLLRQGLADNGFAADIFDSIEDGWQALAGAGYDAMILDLGLSDGDGLELLRRTRCAGINIPILILTARDGIKDRVIGLNLGADDYLLKPFDFGELVARIRALLRRPDQMLGAQMQSGNIMFDTAARTVTIGGQAVRLSRRELEVLELLMRREGKVTPKDLLESKIYPHGKEIASNAIEACVSRLRKRLCDANADIPLHTIRGVGYLFSAIPA